MSDRRKGKSKEEEGDVAVIDRKEGKGIAAFSRGVGSSRGDIGGRGIISGTTIERHRFGELSTAVVQGYSNAELNDFSRVERGRTATFVGIYGGSKAAASFFSRTMTNELMGCIRHSESMSAEHLKEALLITKEAWQESVEERFGNDPYIAAGYGTSCLAGVFWRGKLYLVNVGDSRAITARGSTEFDVIPLLTGDDNVKHSEASKSHTQAPVIDDNRALSADPSTYTISIGPQDRVVIFASNGLWDMMSNEEAVRIVHEFPKEGIAQRLVTEALIKAATRIGMTYEDLLFLKRDNGHRRRAHDDISVVVIFLDHTILASNVVQQENFARHSIVQGSVSLLESSFTALDEVALAPSESRTVFLRNLPYHTDFSTLYRLSSRFGGIQMIQIGIHGFSAQVVFYEAQYAMDFINSKRNRLILKGKLACISAFRERRYRRTFAKIDHMQSIEEAPLTVHVSNLTDDLITEDILAAFFVSLGLELKNYPILHRRQQGRVFGFVTFKTPRDRNIALQCHGLLLLHHHIEVHARQLPTFVLFPEDLNPDD